jgi:hypothetical protein
MTRGGARLSKSAVLIPHLAGIGTSIAVVAAVSVASAAFHGDADLNSQRQGGSNIYAVAEQGASSDIRLLLKIAASTALDSNSKVVVAYDAHRICGALLSYDIRPQKSQVTLGLATYYPEIDELVVDKRVPVADMRPLCESGNYKDNQVFVSNGNIRLAGNGNMNLRGDLVGISD